MSLRTGPAAHAVRVDALDTRHIGYIACCGMGAEGVDEPPSIAVRNSVRPRKARRFTGKEEHKTKKTQAPAGRKLARTFPRTPPWIAAPVPTRPDTRQ